VGDDPLQALPFEDDVDIPLERIIAKLGDDYLLKVQRFEAGGWSFCFDQTGGDLNEEQLREEYGNIPGSGPLRFKVLVFKDDDLVHVARVNIARKVNVSDLPTVNSTNENTRMIVDMFKQQNENLS
jgi:hypothetical protein